MSLEKALEYIEKVIPKNGYDKQYARMIATRVAYIASNTPQEFYDEQKKSSTENKRQGNSEDKV
ncbi:hypothetical protein [uncultured Bacteroides sp.]|uniref:hypothetical protein n=1 Tax=uncultured Bacteroides sp. TaxID=162156 RepID=UPI002AA66555|nr:hypothetical protein [uncultured Bacteroides sp.]